MVSDIRLSEARLSKVGGFLPGNAAIRRGGLFLINIGGPVIAAIVSGKLEMALICAVAGMLLSFAENDGGLARRLALLFVDATAISAAGFAGHFSARVPPLYWVLLIALATGVGFAAMKGREPVLVGRHCGIAFVVAGAVPNFQTETFLFLAGTVVLNAVSRSIDYLLFGPLPLLRQVPLQKPASAGGWVRYALAFGAAAAVGLWLGDRLGEQHGYWIVITTLMVMQPDVRSSYVRIIQRIGGTLAGVAGAWVVATYVHSELAICIGILIVAPLIPHHLTERYWLHTALIALMVLLAYDLAQFDAQGLNRLPLERIEDIVIGAGVALIGTAAAFPRALLSQMAIAAGIGDKRHSS